MRLHANDTDAFLLCQMSHSAIVEYLDGVEDYLGATLSQKVGSRLPAIPHIQVNLPGQE